MDSRSSRATDTLAIYDRGADHLGHLGNFRHKRSIDTQSVRLADFKVIVRNKHVSALRTAEVELSIFSTLSVQT